MDEIWERAVETALEGVTDLASARTLTLDGAVKCVHGRLPPPGLLEKFQNLHHLSIANIGASSLEQFPRLRNLQKLILSDNRIAGGLEHLVEAGLESLRDLDLSNNKIQFIEDLAPLAQLKLVSLDLYECPVTRVKDYRARVFGLIKSLKYLDKTDAEENERPESDDEEEDEDEEDEEDDPGSGEIDGEGKPHGLSNGQTSGGDDIVDVDEEESDADEEETETSRGRENGFTHQGNGFRVSRAGEEELGEEDDEEDVEEDEGNESVEEIDEDDGEEEDVVEVHEVEDSSDDDGDDDDDTEDDEDDDEDEMEGVENEDGDLAEPASTGRLTSTEGEIDGHEQGEDDDDDDDNVESGEEQDGEGDFEDEDDDDDVEEEEEEDSGEGYLVQRVGQPVEVDGVGSDMVAVNEVDGEEEEEEVEDDDEEDDDVEENEDEDDLGEVQVVPPPEPSSSHPKRKRDDKDDGSSADDEDDDVSNRSSKKHH